VIDLASNFIQRWNHHSNQLDDEIQQNFPILAPLVIEDSEKESANDEQAAAKDKKKHAFISKLETSFSGSVELPLKYRMQDMEKEKEGEKGEQETKQDNEKEKEEKHDGGVHDDLHVTCHPRLFSSHDPQTSPKIKCTITNLRSLSVWSGEISLDQIKSNLLTT